MSVMGGLYDTSEFHRMASSCSHVHGCFIGEMCPQTLRGSEQFNACNRVQMFCRTAIGSCIFPSVCRIEEHYTIAMVH